MLAEDTVAEIHLLRVNAEEEFKILFARGKETADKNDFAIIKPRVNNRQTIRCNIECDSVEEYYRISIYIPFLDSFITNLQDRFSKHKSILAGFQCLFPNNPNEISESTINEFTDLIRFYKNDLLGTNEELLAELRFWYRKLARSDASEKPSDGPSAVSYCDDSLHNIKILLEILCVLPVTTAENERSFSTLKRLKTYLRNSLSENRLNGLTLLHVYRNETPEVNSIINKFSEKSRKLNLNI